jgi:glycosyltransferase involved in cell wall biosynthesis
MSNGCPVVCSNAASLPEVVGEDALCVDADDAAALAGACERILDDEKLAARLAERGRERARRFSLERMARELRAAYGEAVGEAAAPGADTLEAGGA